MSMGDLSIFWDLFPFLSSESRHISTHSCCFCTFIGLNWLQTTIYGRKCGSGDLLDCFKVPEPFLFSLPQAWSRLSQNLTLLPLRRLSRVEPSSLDHSIVQPLLLFLFKILLPAERPQSYSGDYALSCTSSPAAGSRLQGWIGRNGPPPSFIKCVCH